MNLTPLGAQSATLGEPERKKLGSKLVKGGVNIGKMTNGVCYDAAAFTRYMLGANISPSDIETKNGQAWLSKFKFKSGTKWNGSSGIKAGAAVGFFRMADNKFFHAAIGAGGTKVRAVNGNRLGAGWGTVDLKALLGEPDEDGRFEYDRTKIEVYISKL